MRWYKLKASGLIYTVIKKEFLEGEYQCIIRFKHTIKPHSDWISLTTLRINAELIPEEKPREATLTPGPTGWFWI